MRNEDGISIILADSYDEVKRLLGVVNAQEAFPLSRLSELCYTHPEAVYYDSRKDVNHLETIAKQFKIRRGVISVDGKAEFLGFNVDWMTKVLADKKVADIEPAPIRRPVLELACMEEKDDPYEDLGYSRR